MKVFASYSRRDLSTLVEIRAVLERAQHDVWYDNEVAGGQLWWNEILAHLRECDAFMFCVSPDSLASRSCRAELHYAEQLGKQLVPVLLRDADFSTAPRSLALTNAVDFREQLPRAGADLVLAFRDVRQPSPLPQALPLEPPPPIVDLGSLRDKIEGAVRLSFDEQRNIVEILGQLLTDHPSAAVDLLDVLNRRVEIASTVSAEIDRLTLIAGAGAPLQTLYAPRRGSGGSRDHASLDLVRSLAAHVNRGRLVPILGVGLADSLLGPRAWLSQQWAASFQFPFPGPTTNIASVAQFVSAVTDHETLLDSMRDFLRGRLLADAAGSTATADISAPQIDLADGAADASASLRALVRAAWVRRRTDTEPDAHLVLAALPCAIYVDASPWGLLAAALEERGKAPVVEICRWRDDPSGLPTSIFERDPNYAPSPEQPLVFHPFGEFEVRDSLVITEDDQFDFLIALAADRDLIPLPVRSALADSALLLLGFELLAADVRVLLRALLGPDGGRRLHRYTHVAAQFDVGEDSTRAERARHYLERYFGRVNSPAIDIYWGGVDDFAADLQREQLASTRR